MALIQSKKVHIRLIGNSFGIIGHGIYLICGTFLGWLAMIFTVLSAVFVLKDNGTEKAIGLTRDFKYCKKCGRNIEHG